MQPTASGRVHSIMVHPVIRTQIPSIIPSRLRWAPQGPWDGLPLAWLNRIYWFDASGGDPGLAATALIQGPRSYRRATPVRGRQAAGPASPAWMCRSGGLRPPARWRPGPALARCIHSGPGTRHQVRAGDSNVAADGRLRHARELTRCLTRHLDAPGSGCHDGQFTVRRSSRSVRWYRAEWAIRSIHFRRSGGFAVCAGNVRADSFPLRFAWSYALFRLPIICPSSVPLFMPAVRALFPGVCVHSLLGHRRTDMVHGYYAGSLPARGGALNGHAPDACSWLFSIRCALTLCAGVQALDADDDACALAVASVLGDGLSIAPSPSRWVRAVWNRSASPCKVAMELEVVQFPSTNRRAVRERCERDIDRTGPGRARYLIIHATCACKE